MLQHRTSYVEDYQSALKSGRGTGRGCNYRPFLEVRDVPSRVPTSKVPLLRFLRIFHLFSHGELLFLLLLDWNDSVVEIDEQVSLEPADTVRISCCQKVRHPSIRGRNTVMTTDFLVTYELNGKLERRAYQVKATAKEAQIKRTAEKLEIEKAYWEEKGIAWKLIISSELNHVLTNNLELLHHWRNIQLSPLVITGAQAWWRKIFNKVDRNRPICQLAALKSTFDGMVIDGFQAAQLLLAKKLCTAPIQSMSVPFIKIGDIEGDGSC